FKYPEKPLKNSVPTNYIKRLLGLPGEIMAIFFGRIFHVPAPEPGQPPYFNDLANPEIDPNHLWRKELGMHENENKELFAAGKFTIVRKTPDVMMAMRRIVYDNDFPAKDLAGPAWQRWHPTQDSGWTAARDHGFDHQGGPKDEVDWLRYRHIVRPMNGEDPP